MGGAIQCCKQGDCNELTSETQLVDMKSAVMTIDGNTYASYTKEGVKDKQAVSVDTDERYAGSQQETTTISDSSRDNLEREKENLKALVQAFASRAVKGVPAGLVDLSSGHVNNGRYFIDRTLRNFTFKPRIEESPGTGGSETAETMVALRNVKSIFGHSGWPDRLEFPGRQHVGASSLQRLVAFEYAEGETSNVVALLLESAEPCGTFTACMNVLRLYNV